MSFEHLFTTSSLNVVVPDTSIQYPPQGDADAWLESLYANSVERNQAFFDEQLHSFLTIRVEHPTPDSPGDPERPPDILLSLLAHVQISLEATYISSLPTPVPETQPPSRLAAPPRTSSLATPSFQIQVRPHHPSILPPETPNPTPLSAEHDQRYQTSEGTLLLTSIWGQNTTEDSGEAFSLLWSQVEQEWVAVYRLSLTVSFLRLSVTDPLLCLTISATLRENPLALTQPKHPLAVYLASVGSRLVDPQSPSSPDDPSVQAKQQTFDGLKEANILEGLRAGPEFKDLHLPTTRLGTVSRQKLFSLPPVALPVLTTPSPSPMTAVRTAHPTLRKSYRKTLPTVSGFRVRMRTVFVPYVLLPSEMVKSLDSEDERERHEAGNDERTVVLCVEIQNSGESGRDVGFLVEKIHVSVGGDGAKATLIGWGDGCFSPEDEEVVGKIFPLRVSAMAQYNLLYAVSFLHAPEEMQGFSLAREVNPEMGTSAADLQRAVAINIFGKPYLVPSEGLGDVSYPTRTFSSRWNCVLDLSPHQNMLLPMDDVEDRHNYHQALPEPPSPFPTATTPRTSAIFSPGSEPQSWTKRHTMPSPLPSGRTIRSPNFQSRTMSMLNPSRKDRESRDRDHLVPPPLALPGTSPRMSYLPPSLTAQIPPSSTTYSAPPPPPFPLGSASSEGVSGYMQPGGTNLNPPLTPAYPPFSATYPGGSGGGGGGFPHSPMSAAAADMGSVVGPSVEIRRERGLGIEGSPIPQTPGPRVGAGFGQQQGPGRGYGYQRQQEQQQGNGRGGDGDIVVSVGLLAVGDLSGAKGKRAEMEREVVLGPGMIYPFEYFTLDIFVFNRSERIRRFEVTCPDRSRRGKGSGGSEVEGLLRRKTGCPGVLPMDARVRIGPLLPSACQSVRMRFLAMSPGVHSIDALTLTDIESGFSMKLRSVMDIVVHESSSH